MHWHSRPLRCEASQHKWLTYSESLTKRLLTLFPDLTVTICSASYAAVHHEERIKLGLSKGTDYFVREIFLGPPGIPIIFARTVIPRQTIENTRPRLTKLSTQPLGHVLFRKPNLYEQSLDFAKLGITSPLIRRLKEHGFSPNKQFYWARRRLFRKAKHSLLINEIFLLELHRF